MQFAGDGAVRARRPDEEEPGDQRDDFGGPVGMLVASGTSWGPNVGVASGTSAQEIGVEFVEAGAGQPQFAGRRPGTDLAGAITLEKMPYKRRGQTFDQFWFFIAPKITEGRWI
jgi:hypothetical protein